MKNLIRAIAAICFVIQLSAMTLQARRAEGGAAKDPHEDNINGTTTCWNLTESGCG